MPNTLIATDARNRLLNLPINPVDLTQSVVLPEPWPALVDQGFPAELHDVVRGATLHAQRGGYRTDRFDEFLVHLGQGFHTRFCPERFLALVTADDPDRRYKEQLVAALAELAAEFGNRVPTTLWDSFAFVGTRPNPTQEAKIFSFAAYLQQLEMSWWVTDVFLHATPKVYSFFLYLLTHVCTRTGRIFDHNCGCASRAPDVGEGSVNVGRPSDITMATRSLLQHVVTEAAVMVGLGLPFELGTSHEAHDILAMG